MGSRGRLMDQRGCDVPPAATTLRQRRKEEARLGVRLAAGIDRYCPLPPWPVGRMYDPRPQRPFVGRCGQPIGRWGSRRGVCGFPVASPALHDTLASTRPRRRGTEAAPGASESTKPTNGCRDRGPWCHSKRGDALPLRTRPERMRSAHPLHQPSGAAIKGGPCPILPATPCARLGPHRS